MQIGNFLIMIKSDGIKVIAKKQEDATPKAPVSDIVLIKAFASPPKKRKGRAHVMVVIVVERRTGNFFLNEK